MKHPAFSMFRAKRARSTPLRWRLCAALVSGAAIAFIPPPAIHAAPDDKSDEADPKAVAALTRSSSYLRSLRAFGFRAEVTRDEVVHGDFKLQRTSNVRVEVRRPDRLRADVSGDQGDRLFVYDGRRLSLLLKSENYYGELPAPPTLLETLDTMDRHSLELPLLDVIYVAMGGKLEPQVRDAGEIGTTSINGTDCTQVAFRSRNVDWQLWIENGHQPLPRKIVITTTDEPTRPQYSAILRWDVTSPVTEDRFKFAPPEGALRLTFAER